MAEVTGHEARLLLLSALRLKRRDHPVRWTVGSAALGVANLLFCAYMERFTGDTGNATALLSLLAVESGVLLTAVAAVFLGEMEGILRKTSLFPYPGRVRFHFTLGGMARHPAILVLWGTGVFALAVIGPIGWIPVTARALFGLLLGALLLICFCTALVVPAVSRAGAAPVAALTALLVAGMAFWAATSPGGHLLAGLLPLQWTVDGIGAAQSGEYGGAFLRALLLALPAAACLYGGTRHA